MSRIINAPGMQYFNIFVIIVLCIIHATVTAFTDSPFLFQIAKVVDDLGPSSWRELAFIAKVFAILCMLSFGCCPTISILIHSD